MAELKNGNELKLNAPIEVHFDLENLFCGFDCALGLTAMVHRLALATIFN